MNYQIKIHRTFAPKIFQTSVLNNSLIYKKCRGNLKNMIFVCNVRWQHLVRIT